MRDAGERLRLTDQVVAHAIAGCVVLDPPAGIDSPRTPTTFTSQPILDAEATLLAANRDTGGPALPADRAELITAGPQRRPLPGAAPEPLLGPDQANAVVEIATSGRPLDVLVGPTGTGKTVTLAVLTRTWEATQGVGSVVGLAPSATAAAALADAVRLPCETTAKWLWETTGPGARTRAQACAELAARASTAEAAGDPQRARRARAAAAQLTGEQARWAWQQGQLVIVDEAAMAGTLELADLAEQAGRAGAKLLLVGDHHQLGPVGAGGGFGLLVRRGHGAALNGLWRFAHRWEANATRGLRRGDPTVLDSYAAHDRLHGGDHESMVGAAHDTWAADRDSGRDTLLVAVDNATVTTLNALARAARLKAGLVATRQNSRQLPTRDGGWVRNGDRWRVHRVHPDGALTLTGTGTDTNAGQVRLPAAYVAEHLQLGYAVTAHRAQGLTVDTCHVVATPAMTRRSLYVAMTRGRTANTAYVITTPEDLDHEPHLRPAGPPPSARDVLVQVLDRGGEEQSATELLQRRPLIANWQELGRGGPGRCRLDALDDETAVPQEKAGERGHHAHGEARLKDQPHRRVRQQPGPDRVEPGDWQHRDHDGTPGDEAIRPCAKQETNGGDQPDGVMDPRDG